MSTLKSQLRDDLSTAMKARDEITTATLRMALTAISTEEVSGKSSRDLTDDDVLAVLRREVKKRHEAATVFDGAGRGELAERERAESVVLQRYLPAALSQAELVELVRVAITETGATEVKQFGQVMKAVQPKVGGRAGGAEVAAEVKRQLGVG